MTDSGPSSSKPAPPRSGGAGFTVVEVIVAIGIIGAAMLTVLMAASSGVVFQGMARQRQTATGVANQVMEQLRGLPLADLQVGISDTNGALKNDPNVKLCRGQGGGKKGATSAYRLFSCTSTSDVGSAESLVYYDCSKLKAGETCPTANAPLGSGNSGTVTADGIPYTWRAYLTSRSSVLAKRFTVVVGWTWRGRAYSTRVQSLAWAPSGCVSNLTHFVSAPCGKGSGGQGDSGLVTVNVSWVDGAGANQSFSWSPGQLTGTYREEGTQGKFMAGSSSLPSGGIASTITDNDVNTTDAETSTLTTLSTTAASYPSSPASTATGTYPYMEVRFDTTANTFPFAQAVSGVSSTPCNVSPFFITSAPCLGLRSNGGNNGIVVGYRKSATVFMPLVRIAAVTDVTGGAPSCSGAPSPCLWQAKYDLQPVTSGGVTTNTFTLWRLFPKVYLGAYATTTTEGAGCEGVNAVCSTFVGALTSVCDTVKLALGGSLTNGSTCGAAGHYGSLGKTYMSTTTCTSAFTASNATTYSPCVGTTASGRMWKVSNLTYTAGSLTTSATASFDYQVLTCAYSDSGGGSPSITKCDKSNGYDASESLTNAQGTKTSTRTITAATPLFRVVVIFPVLSANAVSYEDW